MENTTATQATAAPPRDHGQEQEQIVDVRSVVEAVAASEDSVSDAPLYQVESLCMRCGENVNYTLRPLPASTTTLFYTLRFDVFVTWLKLLLAFYEN